MPAVPLSARAGAPRTAPPAEAVRARRLLLSLYLLLGMTISTWLSRLPSVREALSLSTAELGVVLLVGAVGSLVTVLVAGGVVTRFGSRATLLAAASMFSVATILLGVGATVGSVAVLMAGLVVMTSSFALGNVPMNVETVVVERAIGRTIVPQFHAAFSVGTVVGSLLGAAAAWGGVPLAVHFGAVSVLSLVWRLAAVPGAVLPSSAATVPSGDQPDAPAPRRGAGMRQALGAWRERRTLLIGLLVMAAALSEGSANNWLAIAVVDGFAQPEAVAAVVFGVFVGAMTVARLLGGWVIDRFGPVAVVGTSGIVSLSGLLLFGFAPTLPLAVVGVACWGLGAGLAVPIGLAAVSGDPVRAAGRVAVVSAFATLANLGAPPLLGMAAEVMGTRHALLLVGIALAVTIGLSGAVRRPEAPPAPVASVSAEAGEPTAAVPVPRPRPLVEELAAPGRAGDGPAHVRQVTQVLHGPAPVGADQARARADHGTLHDVTFDPGGAR